MLYIGRHIQATLRKNNMTVTRFAEKLNCTRPNVYKIFAKKNIDIELLWHISQVLKHDFFADLSYELRKTLYNTDENND
ncbi:MAG: helix-turn-helix transcriptional regulator [Muribaculaceae bacterium]|nr:helix-turn-helix transcriptional regulator [Muribaculaceae bacterium]